MNPEIAEKFALRDRVMRRMFLELPMDERVSRGEALQRDLQKTLASSAEIFDRFYRRNLARRAVSHNV